MKSPSASFAQTIARHWSSRTAGAKSRKRQVAVHVQLEALEGRRLLAVPKAYPDPASYWVGDWQTANGDLLDVSESPGHHPGDPPVLSLFYQTGYFEPNFTTAPYPYYSLNYYDNNPDPDASTLSGQVYGDASFSGQVLGSFVFHATPNPTPDSVTDTFTGSITVGGKVTPLQATFIGDINYPAASEPGWGLPRDRPDTPTGNTPPPASGNAVLEASIQGVGPSTTIVHSRNSVVTKEVVVTITNVGATALPARAAKLTLKNESKGAKLSDISVDPSLALFGTRTAEKQRQFIQTDLPALAPGESEDVTVTIREMERWKIQQDTQTKIFAIEMDVTQNKAQVADRAYISYDEYVRP
jgi:hypothetical protein